MFGFFFKFFYFFGVLYVESYCVLWGYEKRAFLYYITTWRACVCIYNIKTSINPINARKPEAPLPDAPSQGTRSAPEITAKPVPLCLLLQTHPGPPTLQGLAWRTAAVSGQTSQRDSWGWGEAGEIWHHPQGWLSHGLVWPLFGGYRGPLSALVIYNLD